MTLDEWIAYYNSKTPEAFKPKESLAFLFDPDKGFCEVGMDKDCVYIGQVAGDWRFWKAKAEDIARKMGCRHGSVFLCRRSILAYIRLLGYKVMGKEDINGYTKYVCAHRESGKYALVFPTGRFLHDVHIYYVEWEV